MTTMNEWHQVRFLVPAKFSHWHPVHSLRKVSRTVLSKKIVFWSFQNGRWLLLDLLGGLMKACGVRECAGTDLCWSEKSAYREWTFGDGFEKLKGYRIRLKGSFLNKRQNPATKALTKASASNHFPPCRKKTKCYALKFCHKKFTRKPLLALAFDFLSRILKQEHQGSQIIQYFVPCKKSDSLCGPTCAAQPVRPNLCGATHVAQPTANSQ